MVAVKKGDSIFGVIKKHTESKMANAIIIICYLEKTSRLYHTGAAVLEGREFSLNLDTKYKRDTKILCKYYLNWFIPPILILS